MENKVLGRAKETKLAGRVENVKKFNKVVMFKLRTANNGYLDFKSFENDIINFIDNNMEVVVSSYEPKRSCWSKNNGEKVWTTDIIANELIVEAMGGDNIISNNNDDVVIIDRTNNDWEKDL